MALLNEEALKEPCSIQPNSAAGKQESLAPLPTRGPARPLRGVLQQHELQHVHYNTLLAFSGGETKYWGSKNRQTSIQTCDIKYVNEKGMSWAGNKMETALHRSCSTYWKLEAYLLTYYQLEA